MMEIRHADERDIPAIVSLLKLSLGESLMPKSEAFWRWKHLDNPFGPSPVLVAEENGELIGVRAFMRWDWQQGDRVFHAVRAVDTATHPAHQGRGIFKTLTLKLLDYCRAHGIDFVFNTPNEKSRPGYLKMGWQEVGRLPIAFRPYWSLGSRRDLPPPDWDEAVQSLSRLVLPTRCVSTAISPRYLRWRYAQNPNVGYSVICGAGDQPFVLVYRKKKIKGLDEIRVVEFLGPGSSFSDALGILRTRERGFGLLTVSGTTGARVGGMSVGPRVTVRMLSDFAPVRTFSEWSPSLGDLELF